MNTSVRARVPQVAVPWHKVEKVPLARYSETAMPLPPLRYLDVARFDQNGETMIVLRDTEGIVDEPLILTPIAFFIAAQLDGTNDVSDIQYLFSNASGGRILRSEDILRVVETLDQHGFLLSETYLAQRDAVAREFSQSTVRSAHLAGKSYPEEPGELREYLDAQFTRDGGPGELPSDSPADLTPVSCLIVPHIDYERGGHSYAHGYRRMRARGRPDTVLIFGVAHAGAATPFILTRKHFDTPLGLVQTDIDLVDAIAAQCGWDPFADELVHRTEHSIEFQAVMLAHLFGTDVKIVPILCGPFMESDGAIATVVAEFLDACRRTITASGKRVTVVAAADLAHVGPRFGDTFDVDENVLKAVDMRDREDLAHVVAVQPDAWYQSVLRDGNARRVCGLNCIYAALKAVDGAIRRGDLVHYGYAPDPAGGIVSFANVVFDPR